MKTLRFYLGIGLILATGLSLISCSSPAAKAKKIEEGLSPNGGTLYKDVLSENPQIVTYSIEPDSTTVVLVHDLKANRADTLTHLIPKAHIVEVVPVEDGYLYISKEVRQDGKEHYLYNATIKRNIENPKEKLAIPLRVVPDREEVAASAYVIDRERKKITLSSYLVESTFAEIYHTVYDFKGNKLVEDPIHINIPTQQTYSDERTEYVWECQKCEIKRTSTKKPARLELVGGNGCFHDWVKIGKI